MTIVNFFMKKDPQLAGFSFDAVLSESYTVEAVITEYPIESGARVNDHRALKPITYTLTGAISNNPLRPTLANPLAGLPGAITNYSNDSMVAAVAGLSVGYLAGSDNTRASSAYETLLALYNQTAPFDVEAGLITLKNMVITRIEVPERVPENENTLIFVATLREFISVDRLNAVGQPSLNTLQKGSIAEGGLAPYVDRGVQTPKDVSTSEKNTLKSFLSIGA